MKAQNSTKPKLFLHIGMPKTGTTTIQDSLAFNQKYLKEKDIFYPINPASELLYGLVYKNAYPNFMSSYIAPVEIAFESIRTLFLKSDCKNLLISKEGLSMITNKQADPKKGTLPYIIKSLFHEFDVNVIFYVRRQDLLLESAYKCVCLVHNFANVAMTPTDLTMYAFDNFDEDDDVARLIKSEFYNKKALTKFDLFCLKNHMQYRQDLVISKWAEVFGKENMIIRPFERNQMPEGLLYDFYRNALKFTDEEVGRLKKIEDSNISLSRDTLEFKLATGIDDNLPFNCIDSLINAPSHNGTYFTNEERKRFVSFFDQVNESIAKEYLERVDGKLFYDKIEEFEEYKGLTLEKAREIQRKIIPILKCYSTTTADKIPQHMQDSTLEEIIHSVRTAYFENTKEEYIKEKLDRLFHSLKKAEKDIVIYGVFGKLAELTLEVADSYKKSVRIYVSDKIVQDKLTYRGYYVANLNAIKALKPHAILIAAKESGESIRKDLDELSLSNTIIYPAYDFSDKIWEQFLSALFLPIRNNTEL